MVAAGPESRCRARMLRITSDEWTPSDIACAQADSTAGNPSVSTAARIATIWRSPSSEPASFRRTRSKAAGSIQSLNGAPLRKAPGLRARIGVPWIIDRFAAPIAARMLRNDAPLLADNDPIGVSVNLDRHANGACADREF